VNGLTVEGELSTVDRYRLAIEVAAYLKERQNARLAFAGKPPAMDGFGVRVGAKSRANHRNSFDSARSAELA
jgi:hypothetical protein